jgi:hypothetical protein
LARSSCFHPEIRLLTMSMSFFTPLADSKALKIPFLDKNSIGADDSFLDYLAVNSFTVESLKSSSALN